MPRHMLAAIGWLWFLPGCGDPGSVEGTRWWDLSVRLCMAPGARGLGESETPGVC